MRCLILILLFVISTIFITGCSQATEFDSCKSACLDVKRPCLVSESIFSCMQYQRSNTTINEYCFNECKGGGKLGQ